MKNSRFHRTLTVAGLVFAAMPPVFSAEPTEKTKASDLEARVLELERRIQELEDSAGVADHQSGTPFGRDWELQPPAGFGQNFDDILNRFKREMDGLGMGMRKAPGQLGRHLPFGQNDVVTNKPRLGVRLDAASDDLRERFKNDVKNGSFVMEVVQGSPAEKAGINVGDCIVSFAGKVVGTPDELIDVIKSAPMGKQDVLVMRRGESLALKVDLEATDPEEAAENRASATDDTDQERRGWLRRGRADAKLDRPGKVTSQIKTSIKASALELPDDLTRMLKLTDEQRDKMADVLAKQSKLLSEEIASKGDTRNLRSGTGFSFSLNGDVTKLVEKYAADAEKELVGTLNAEQLAQWKQYRIQHSSVSYSTQIESSGTGVESNGGMGMGF